MTVPSRRYHVALVDPLPAGFEPQNPRFATTASSKDGDDSDPWWWSRWYEYQALRDDHAEAFRTSLPAGEYQYSYVAAATTPGSFVAQPAKAEEMYAPETFGRSESAKVVIRDAN
jgi:uncharacterized protein YfaS (alpha-2-macroglobulin family)